MKPQSSKYKIYLAPISDNKLQGMELNPWMLTLLGIGAGVLVVIVLVAVAIRVHASRGGRAGRRRRWVRIAQSISNRC